MAAVRNLVNIKGIKDGLVFLLDDACEYSLLIEELKKKLEPSQHNIWSGPVVNVQVKLGKRELTDREKDEIRGIIGQHENLLIASLESEQPEPPPAEPEQERMAVLRGVIRSGQTVRHDGNLLYIGDVNPGGTIVCTGDIFVMGALRGMAHAGSEGSEHAVIAASYMRPTQLRIAGIISRPPDEWGIDDAYMEFAYIRDGKMEIDKLAQMHRFHQALARG